MWATFHPPFLTLFFPFLFCCFYKPKKKEKKKKRKRRESVLTNSIYILFFFSNGKGYTKHKPCKSPFKRNTWYDLLPHIYERRHLFFFFALSFGYLIKQIQAQVHSLFFPFGTKKSMVLKEEKGKGKKKTQIKRSKVEEGREKKK